MRHACPRAGEVIRLLLPAAIPSLRCDCTVCVCGGGLYHHGRWWGHCKCAAKLEEGRCAKAPNAPPDKVHWFAFALWPAIVIDSLAIEELDTLSTRAQLISGLSSGTPTLPDTSSVRSDDEEELELERVANDIKDVRLSLTLAEACAAAHPLLCLHPTRTLLAPPHVPRSCWSIVYRQAPPVVASPHAGAPPPDPTTCPLESH